MAASIPSDRETIDWLRLARTDHVGPITFRQLLERYGSAALALEALPELARQGGRKSGLKPPPLGVIEQEVTEAARHDARPVRLNAPDYPALLRRIDDAPPVLYVRGHAYLANRRCVALVGARNASLNGRKLAEHLARELGRLDFVVVSGLARGIDGAAHRGALETGTIAAIAGGIDVVYPPDHADLQAAIAERGLLLAEQPPGTQPQARHFPRRNRIISGCALGVVVVEAALRSGSLITARLAGDQGREVMAVPGSPLDVRCRGANALIREGALLVEDAAQIAEALMPLAGGAEPESLPFAPHRPPQPSAGELVEARRRIGELLGPSPVAVDELLRECQLSHPVLQTVLLELELAGRLERLPGGLVVMLIAP